MADSEKQSETPKAAKEVIATKVSGTVKWFNVKSGYGFINRSDTKEDLVPTLKAKEIPSKTKKAQLKTRRVVIVKKPVKAGEVEVVDQDVDEVQEEDGVVVVYNVDLPVDFTAVEIGVVVEHVQPTLMETQKLMLMKKNLYLHKRTR